MDCFAMSWSGTVLNGKGMAAVMQERKWEIMGGSLCYEENKGRIAVTGFQGLAGEVQIPAQIEGMPVTEISKKAFLSKKNLRRVMLPDTLTEVGDWAFAYCGSLEQLILPRRQIQFGRSVFLECGRLSLMGIAGKEEAVGALLAAAVTMMQAPYLLDIPGAGSREWLAKWDARMLDILHRPDDEGYSRQVLCGEEDYGSTDLNAYLQEKRREKVRILLLRLLYPDMLPEAVRRELEEYLREHTKGRGSEETWQVVLQEHGDERRYYQLFMELGCARAENFEGLLEDMGEGHPEMKAYLMRYQAEKLGHGDFFAGLEL